MWRLICKISYIQAWQIIICSQWLWTWWYTPVNTWASVSSCHNKTYAITALILRVGAGFSWNLSIVINYPWPWPYEQVFKDGTLCFWVQKKRWPLWQATPEFQAVTDSQGHFWHRQREKHTQKETIFFVLSLVCHLWCLVFLSIPLVWSIIWICACVCSRIKPMCKMELCCVYDHALNNTLSEVQCETMLVTWSHINQHIYAEEARNVW